MRHCRHWPACHLALAIYTVAATRSTTNASMMSPTLMSLNFSKPMPHSKPALTSDTSSLKRRSEPILPSWIDDVVAQQPRLRVARARDPALGDHAAGDGAELRRLEDVAHLRRADPHFLERRLEQAGHRLLHLVDDVVDDRVQADVHLLAIGDVGGVAVRAAR